jgi:hypothetical protein
MRGNHGHGDHPLEFAGVCWGGMNVCWSASHPAQIRQPAIAGISVDVLRHVAARARADEGFQHRGGHQDGAGLAIHAEPHAGATAAQHWGHQVPRYTACAFARAVVCAGAAFHSEDFTEV